MRTPARRASSCACALVALTGFASSAALARDLRPPEQTAQLSTEASARPVATLLPELESSDPEVRQAAAAALSERAASADPQAIAALIPRIHAPDSKVRYHAEWGLARAGRPAVPGLLAVFRARSDDEGRARIARVLGQIGLAATPALADLRAALADPDSATCGSAAYALGRMRAREVLPELVTAYVRSRKLSNQRQIAEAMQRIGSDQSQRQAREQLVESLAVQLSVPDVSTRAAAVDTTAVLYRQARKGSREFPSREALRVLVPGLIAALDDPDPERERAALGALTLAGRDARAATPELARRLARDNDPQTLYAIKAALAAIATPEAERLLAERAAAEALEARIRTRYSVRDHQGRTELLIFRIAGDAHRGLRLSTRFFYPGRTPRAPERVVIHLESTSPQSRFEDTRTLTWLADGVSIPMTPLDRSWSRGQNGGVIEQLSGTLSVDDFRRVAGARTLRARVGAVSLALTAADRSALRHFASKIPAESAPAQLR